ncbi:MAG: YqzL family protein [Clostridia bacterium]|nr:YqzL family protein [Clostridia bacterium]
MGNQNSYKKLEDLGWEVFSKTGNINDYGIIVSAREKQEELKKEENENLEREM